MITPAGTMQQPVFSINSALRRIYLKSIIWQGILNETTNNYNFDETDCIDIIKSLSIAAFPAQNYTSITNSILPPALDANLTLMFTKFGQYFFNEIRFDNEIRFQVVFDNISAFNYSISTGIIIETIE
jgi:hypothetical protein